MPKGIGDRGDYKDGSWALVDEFGNALTEYKYSFVEPCGEGYFKADIGSKQTLLRPDGTEVFNDIFNCLYTVHKGFIMHSITIRKTATTPTRYKYGLLHVSGDYVFPLMFDGLDWIEDRECFYAEIDKSPYIISTDCGIFDPQKRHLPKKKELSMTKFFEQMMNWTLPGLSFFYRDTNSIVTPGITYKVGDVFRAGFYVDVSTKLLKPAQRTRFIIASAHAAMLYEDPDNEEAQKYGLCVLHCNSYFKVMDIYEKDGITQILLLHIPPLAASLMRSNMLDINMIDEALGSQISLVDMARASLDEKLQQEVHPRSLDSKWIKRTHQLVGLDNHYYQFPFEPVEPEGEEEISFSNAIHKFADDADIKLDDILEEKDNFDWDGPKGTVCEGCIYSKGIHEDASGCGRLPQKMFRDNVIKNRCDYRKIHLHVPSSFEKTATYRTEKRIQTEQKQSDKYALDLLTDFIDVRLYGDISALATFDFRSLRDNEKYGDCRGFAFDVVRTNIMKAIQVLAFSDVWPTLNVDALDKYDYSLSYVNNCQTLMGSCILDDYFKTLSYFEVPHSLTQRALDFYQNGQFAIGNILVYPSKRGESIFQSKSYYFDGYLKDLKSVLLGNQNSYGPLKGSVYKNRNVMDDYKGEEGFEKFVKSLMLEDFMDESSNPKDVFEGIKCSTRGLRRDYYISAVEKYLDFCEPFVAKRSERIAEKLKKVLTDKAL